MNLLITGGAGFIGSHFIHYILNKYDDYHVVNVDRLTYASNLSNVATFEHHPYYTFIQGNIENKDLITHIVKNNKIDTIVNFAAETHVDRSIHDSSIFVKTNVLGTQTLLEVALENNIQKFIQISTDEVYGDLGASGYFRETTPLSPKNPYSATKASSDHLVLAYHETYDINVNITRCSNNYGPYQFPEKLIPLLILNALEEKELPIYGDGTNVRDWIHVTDHCAAIDLVIHKGKTGEIYNIGSHNERNNLEIAESIIEKLGKSKKLITFVQDRLGHDRRYAIDAMKISKQLNWKPNIPFEKGITDTIKWYVKNRNWW
ncbi:dTDP-glucose 4,6-dehydratase [Chengkuizengella sediminis]|uniref:dTDP-glucose 4,6-dehydratase n=1 Tax=Chengkuizengella sediminis TaxID=1885917 RepID=UPI00138A4CC1|nr:dTDP-glucose 4,6-dehydratase [Chengkuizengella sediminis]NDI36227.1 dTDP-glucose 4,6-dehydratase [Chengkuizengella sediminis]